MIKTNKFGEVAIQTLIPKELKTRLINMTQKKYTTQASLIRHYIVKGLDIDEAFYENI